MMQSSVNEGADEDQLRKVSGFLQICKGYETSKGKEQELATWGYRQFENKKATVDVQAGNVKHLNGFVKERTEKLCNWKAQVKDIYEDNFKAAHLQGKKLSEFYSFIAGN